MNAIMDSSKRDNANRVAETASAKMTLNDAINDNCYVNASSDSDRQQMSLNGRPIGLRRQPTKYPHGLGISVQTMVCDEQDRVQTYSRASTLRSSCASEGNRSSEQGSQSSENCHRKYRISMISNPENLAELQVRRYKYPLTGNYYLDQQEATKSSLAMLEYGKRFCKWKYLRWPILFVASVLLFFGLITYCIWLHDVSVARERYLQQRSYQLNDESESVIGDTSNMLDMQHSSTDGMTTDANHYYQESTILRAIGVQTQKQQPKEQKLTTMEYAVSKGEVTWEKERKNLPLETTTTLTTEEAALVPSSVVRFTSGHQNSFGVPIEEDERVLRLINDLFPLSHQESSTSNNLARVSPTIPPVARSKPTSAMTTVAESGCYSTSLTMCQGVLDYDLTYNSTTKLDSNEKEVYQSLINSNCSARAVEFVCATLEPECRPSHIGVLPPCRRICKAILEACSIIIANSDTLTAIFDCNFYPDSSDPHKCEDPTRRRGYCYENEFECYDRTCIPSQWQCDNLKDCATGEDEDNCLICDQQDEFRCRSNEKCVPDSVRCDLKYDCFDGSDEEDCEEYGSGEEAAFDEAALNSFPRVFSYASFLSPNQSNDKLYTYITATTDDESGTKFQVHEITNRTSGVSNEEVTNSVPGEGGPKGFVNFRDSKEIMMTSDSENKFKYSSARAANRTSANKFSTASTTPLKPAASMRVTVTTEVPVKQTQPTIVPANCAPHQLRCVSGKCITVDQLCDKKIDCPDGADELMCVYKDRTTTVRSNETTTTITRTDKRTIRTTTIKRKVKT